MSALERSSALLNLFGGIGEQQLMNLFRLTLVFDRNLEQAANCCRRSQASLREYSLATFFELMGDSRVHLGHLHGRFVCHHSSFHVYTV